MIIDASPVNIRLAAKTIINGGTVVYPTDTAYGLGANALDDNAIDKVFKLKGRDHFKPIHVVVKDLEMAKQLVEFNPLAESLFLKYLPGPLTLVLKKKSNLSNKLTGGLPTLGIRLPDNRICLELSELTNLPYTATSANISGQITPYSISQVSVNPDIIIDAGELPRVEPSTIIDVTLGKIVVLREGPIKFS